MQLTRMKNDRNTSEPKRISRVVFIFDVRPMRFCIRVSRNPWIVPKKNKKKTRQQVDTVRTCTTQQLHDTDTTTCTTQRGQHNLAFSVKLRRRSCGILKI